MGIQEEFDRCYTFQTLVRDALGLVREDWVGAIDGFASTIAGLDPDAWDDAIDAISTTFADDRRPAGLDAEQIAAYEEEVGAIEARALIQIRRRASEMVAASGQVALDVAQASAYLESARDTFLGGDTLSGEWLVKVMIGCHLGLKAGGAPAFAAGPPRTLYNLALQFAKDNAENLLEVIDTTADRPSDSVGISLFREARKRLRDFVEQS